MTPPESPFQPLVEALAAGASVVAQRGHTTVRKAYHALTDYLATHYPDVEYSSIEKKPTALHRRQSMILDFPANAEMDAQLFELATQLTLALDRHAPTSAATVAVELQRVKARLLEVRKIQSSDKGVVVSDSEFEQMVVDDVQVGEVSMQAKMPSVRVEMKGKSHIDTFSLNVSTGKENSAALIQRYLNWLIKFFNPLKLETIDPEMAKSERANPLRLSAVYTALLTRSVEGHEYGFANQKATAHQINPDERRQISALEQLNHKQHLVLLGDPGSGKSTFVNFVALCMAGELSTNKDKDKTLNLKLLRAPLPTNDETAIDNDSDAKKPRAKLQKWQHGALLPLRIILRDLVAWNGFPPAGTAATAKDLWDFVTSELKRSDQGECCEAIRSRLKDDGGLILLDGLDEVPEAKQRRQQLRQAINDFCASYPKCRVLVTSRPYAYQNAEWQLDGFAVSMLDNFSRGQIRHFIDRWYDERAQILDSNPIIAKHRAQQLKQTIFANERLYALAERPLLLTLTAGIHAWKEGSLPEDRAALYEQAVELLLFHWDERIVNNPHEEIANQSLSKLLGIERRDLRPVLEQIAFKAHHDQQGVTGSADIAIETLWAELRKLPNKKQQHEISEKLLIRYLEQRSGLLISRDEDHYALPHRTFQEFLAATYLLRDDFPYQLVRLTRNDPERWREVTLLAAAQCPKTPSLVWDLANKLAQPKKENEPPLTQAWSYLLAGQVVDEAITPVNRQRPEEAESLQQVRNNLISVLEASALPAAERALAGRTLAKLGDPRPYANSLAGMQFCFVPQGDFYRTADNQLAALDTDFWIGRFPVTQAQFAEFTQAGGYKIERYWTEAIEADHWKDGAVWNWIGNNYQSTPHSFGNPFDLPNHPVVGITWYEAVAFCRWLSEHPSLTLPGSGREPSHDSTKDEMDWIVRLPTEAEWEKVARGGVDIPQQGEIRRLGDWAIGLCPLIENPLPQRNYPWGEQPPNERANYSESKINATSAIGCFANGTSPYGVEELCGTVWEWSQDDHENGGKVLRGRAYYSDEILTSARDRNDPYYRFDSGGFRCVIVPSSR